jgi:endonuclease III-like uncharacterized protein
VTVQAPDWRSHSEAWAIKQIGEVDAEKLKKLIEPPGLRRIRNRQSYGMWKNILTFLNTNPTKAQILRRFLEEIDNARGFGSETAATYAEESLEQLLKDEGLKS